MRRGPALKRQETEKTIAAAMVRFSFLFRKWRGDLCSVKALAGADLIDSTRGGSAPKARQKSKARRPIGTAGFEFGCGDRI
jgi:hypothetical protein